MILSNPEILIKAVCGNRMGELKELTAQGAYLSMGNGLLLFTAAYHGHLDALKYLVEHGAQFGPCTHAIGVLSYCKGTVLTTAAMKGKLDIVQYLVEQVGADASYQNNYALQLAAEKGHTSVVDYLKQVV